MFVKGKLSWSKTDICNGNDPLDLKKLCSFEKRQKLIQNGIEGDFRFRDDVILVHMVRPLHHFPMFSYEMMDTQHAISALKSKILLRICSPLGKRLLKLNLDSNFFE